MAIHIEIDLLFFIILFRIAQQSAHNVNQQKAQRDEAVAICTPKDAVIGDCVVPTTIYHATKAACYAALDIGRKA